jgi:hypothetical protein
MRSALIVADGCCAINGGVEAAAKAAMAKQAAANRIATMAFSRTSAATTVRRMFGSGANSVCLPVYVKVQIAIVAMHRISAPNMIIVTGYRHILRLNVEKLRANDNRQVSPRTSSYGGELPLA